MIKINIKNIWTISVLASVILIISNLGLALAPPQTAVNILDDSSGLLIETAYVDPVYGLLGLRRIIHLRSISFFNGTAIPQNYIQPPNLLSLDLVPEVLAYTLFIATSLRRLIPVLQNELSRWRSPK